MARSFRFHGWLCLLCGCFFIRNLFGRPDQQRSPKVVWKSWYTLYSSGCIVFLCWTVLDDIVYNGYRAAKSRHVLDSSLRAVANASGSGQDHRQPDVSLSWVLKDHRLLRPIGRLREASPDAVLRVLCTATLLMVRRATVLSLHRLLLRVRRLSILIPSGSRVNSWSWERQPLD
ncbi:hypothetical protein MRX96_040228 [Rhipicephalus microplus]